MPLYSDVDFLSIAKSRPYLRGAAIAAPENRRTLTPAETESGAERHTRVGVDAGTGLFGGPGRDFSPAESLFLIRASGNSDRDLRRIKADASRRPTAPIGALSG